MNSQQIAQLRLQQQQILPTHFTSAPALMKWMGCIQAQDYAGAKWAIGNRVKSSTDASIEKDFNEGNILRTHILRPTWHFVSPEDIGWMRQLTAPKIKAFCKKLHAKLEITEKDLQRSKNILAAALSNKNYLTRSAIIPLLKKAKINTDDIRLGFLLMDAELEGLICSGPRQGKQFTYALLSDRAPASPRMERDEAIARITRLYFNSRGPATVNDLQWWSGLNMTDIKKGLLLNKDILTHTVTNGQAYWFSKDINSTAPSKASVFLLPAYDEYAVAYKDRSDILHSSHLLQAGHGIFKPIIVINGQVTGTWSRKEMQNKIVVETSLLRNSKTAVAGVAKAAARYAAFLGKTL